MRLWSTLARSEGMRAIQNSANTGKGSCLALREPHENAAREGGVYEFTCTSLNVQPPKARDVMAASPASGP